MLVNTLIANRLKAASRFLDTQKWHKRPHISCLESLPVELLQSIAGYLSLSSAASFALSSKYIWYVMGSQYWHQLRSQPFEYKIFHGLLEKTMTGHWLCYECLTFHPKPKLDSSSRYYFSLPAWKCDKDDFRYLQSPDTYPLLPISYLKLRMAMNRHLLGPEHGEGLAFFSTSACRDSFRDGRCSASTEAVIVANELYMRCQTRTAIPNSKDFKYIQWQSICPHITIYNPRPMKPIIKCLLSHRNTGSCEKCQALRQCRYCNTEFKIQISRFGSDGHILEITYWKNFGAGRSDGDPKWARHFGSHYRRGFHAKVSPGSIQAAFESEYHKIQMNKPLSRFRRALARERVGKLVDLVL